MVKNPAANAKDARNTGSIPKLRRPFGIGNDNPLQYSCLENSMDRGAWWATVLEATKSQTWLNINESVKFKPVFVQGSTLYRIGFQ